MGRLIYNDIDYTGSDVVEITQADYNALPDTKYSDDVTYLIKDVYSPSSTKEIGLGDCYSTIERVVGCWTDGKPLYQKTYTNVSITNASDNVVDSDFGTEKVLQMYYLSTKGILNALFNYNSTTNDTLFVNDGILKYYLEKSGSWWNALNTVDIVIYYTKTTDTAGSGPWTPSGVPAVHYSTDEQVIGTWIDGSTLYEKTIQTTSPSSRTDSEIADLTSLNIDILVDLKGVINSTTVNQFVPIFWSYPADSFSNSIFSATYYSKTEKKLRQVTLQAAYQSSTEYVTIQYTKSS